VDCNDADICTDDTCDEGSDVCDNLFDPTNDPSCAFLVCGNGQLDVGEQCDDGNTVSGDCCSAACQLEAAGTACDDGLFCNDGETCDGAGSCGGGSATDCDDGIGCTVDSCNETGDVCDHDPDDSTCDDDLFCNGVESCDALQDCVPGAVVDCDDADICTDDSCNETDNLCDNVFDLTNGPECLAQCTDDDGDGWFIDGGDCGVVDCDDTDPATSPGAAEVCDDNRDNDCDGLIDAADDACGGGWQVRSGPLQDNAYAGSDSCAECHQARFDSWSASLHARLQIPPGDAQAAGFPLPDGIGWTDVLFVIGQKWRSEYIDLGGMVLPERWNYLNGAMEATPGGPYDCGACHTTGYDAAATYTDSSGDPVPGIAGSWTEFNIGCEACHGPGAEHAGDPSRDNINRIELDWTNTDEGVVSPAVRSSQVCGNCHWGPTSREVFLNLRGENHTQYNDWTVSGHASSLEFTAVNTYCAKCHSPGNAEADATEHYFRAFEPTAATQVACIACHDPHNVSGPFWDVLDWPAGGQQDPRDLPPAIRRYQGTDYDPSTNDYVDVENPRANGACTDCHRLQPGFRRHVDASPPETVDLEPPFNFDQVLTVPHGEHIDEEYATCLDCHMPYSRSSANDPDIRSHSLLPNERLLGSGDHYNVTCGPCHATAQDCTMCHGQFGRIQDGGPWANRGDGKRKRQLTRDGTRPQGRTGGAEPDQED
jgi:cysteine-rich repeat protein